MDTQTNWTELLEREYGTDPMDIKLVTELRTERHMTDEEIYSFLESFY